MAIAQSVEGLVHGRYADERQPLHEVHAAVELHVLEQCSSVAACVHHTAALPHHHATAPPRHCPPHHHHTTALLHCSATVLPHHCTLHLRTTAPLHHCTTAPLHHCTTAPLHHCTTAPLHHCTTAPLHHCTTAPLHHCTTAPLHHCTTAPLHHCTTVPLHHCTTAPLQESAPGHSHKMWSHCKRRRTSRHHGPPPYGQIRGTRRYTQQILQGFLQHSRLHTRQRLPRSSRTRHPTTRSGRRLHLPTLPEERERRPQIARSYKLR